MPRSRGGLRPEKPRTYAALRTCASRRLGGKRRKGWAANETQIRHIAGDRLAGVRRSSRRDERDSPWRRSPLQRYKRGSVVVALLGLPLVDGSRCSKSQRLSPGFASESRGGASSHHHPTWVACCAPVTN